MDKRNANIIAGAGGGTASRSAKTYKISLPTEWVKRLGLANDRAAEISFDGERIIIEKKKSVQAFIENKLSKKHLVRIIRYYDADKLCTLIAADFSDKTLSFENYTDLAVKRAFGNYSYPDWSDFEGFLADRCIPQSRSGLKYYLNALGVDSYNAIDIIRKTQGRMAEDNQWLEIEEIAQ